MRKIIVTDFEDFSWSSLNKTQLGRYAEYLVKMEFVLCGFDVFTSEVDDHGIDLVVRTKTGNHYDIQVKSFRHGPGKSTPYVFIQKQKFKIHPSLFLALVQFVSGQTPTLYLVPSCVENGPNRLFESRDYGENRKSMPEWGLTFSKKKLERLAEECTFRKNLANLQ